MTRTDDAKDAMREGKQAYRDGKNRGRCPELPGTLEYTSWQYGWRMEQRWVEKDAWAEWREAGIAGAAQ